MKVVQNDIKRFEKRAGDGFVGQRMIGIPKRILASIKKNNLINKLYMTDIGFFPHAKFHFRERKSGCKQYILLYCLEGQGVINVMDNKIELKSNAFYIIPPEVKHAYYAIQNDPWSIYWIHFTGSQSEYIFRKFSEKNRTTAKYISFEERRVDLFENILDVLEKGFSSENIEFVNISLWQLLGSFIFNSYFKEIGKENIERDIVTTSIKYMKEHLKDPLKVSSIAGHLNYSSSHFFSLFKKKTGYSPIHFFTQLKIQKACQILSFTDMSIKEISISLGYEDPLYFSRLFKKTMNVSPLQYRKDYRH